MRGNARKRRRTPPSDWQLPVLTEWGFRPKQQRLLVVIASTFGVLLTAVAIVVAIAGLGTDLPPQRQATAAVGSGAAIPQEFHGWPSPKLFDPIANRKQDARPLTAKELFAQKSLAVDKKLTLKLVGSDLAADCASVLWGQTLVEQTTAAGCTQAARGVYLSSDKRYVAQYTLLNLRDGKAAGELVASLKTLYRGGWVKPLATDQAAFVEGGYSQAGGYALGHYVGLVWLAKVDGAEPTVKDDLVSLALTLRGAEKPVYRRVVAITGPGTS